MKPQNHYNNQKTRKKNLKIMTQKITWKPVKINTTSSQRPSPRWGHSSCVIKDEVVVFGGYADSLYMNDMWVFNSNSMEWKQIKATGQIPSHRSNSTLNYDSRNNRLLLFGGGGNNKSRFNQLYELNWETKQWSIISYQESQKAPWQRTYHCTELLYPYLIVFGGQGVTDLDDLWAFNLQTKKWIQINFEKNAVRPCGRRFHSSCTIGNQFFVIAGCYSKYRPLNDIFSIDLTKLVQTGSGEQLQWNQRKFKDEGFLTRWGQSCAVQQNNIYIFGGRFSNDLNDLLVFDTEKNKLRLIKVNTDTMPKPRRRSCLEFIGNCLLMFGGFNVDYYNDLHFINIAQNQPKINRSFENKIEIKTLVNNPQFSDIQILAKNGKSFYCHKGILCKAIGNQNKMHKFVSEINSKQDEKQLQNLLIDLYQGYGLSKLLHKYLIELPCDLYEQQSEFAKFIDIYRKASPQNQALRQQKRNGIARLQQDQYQNFKKDNQQNKYTDFILNAYFGKNCEVSIVKFNMILIFQNSKFFRNILSSHFKYGKRSTLEKQIEIQLPFGDELILEIVMQYLSSGRMVIPQSFSHNSWIEMYKLADYLAIGEVQSIALQQLYSKIDQVSVNSIFKFATEYKLEDLAICCARFKLTKYPNRQIKQNNKFMRISYELNRFEIKQALMTKPEPKLVKKQVSNCQDDQQEDKENNLQTCNN